MTNVTQTERKLIDAAVKSGKVRKMKPGKAKGVNKRNAPMTMTKPTRKTSKRPATAKTRDANTITTVDIAAAHKINPKTLRARIRRNIDIWSPPFKNGVMHVFADNKTTRNKIDALLS